MAPPEYPGSSDLASILSQSVMRQHQSLPRPQALRASLPPYPFGSLSSDLMTGMSLSDVYNCLGYLKLIILLNAYWASIPGIQLEQRNGTQCYH